MNENDIVVRGKAVEIVNQNGNKFPSLIDYSIGVVNTIWLIYQHGTVEMLNQALKMMVEARNKNLRNIEMYRILQTADRICATNFGYQYFGTQINTPIVDFPATFNFSLKRISLIPTLCNIQQKKPKITNNTENLVKIWDEASKDVACEANPNSNLAKIYYDKFNRK